MRLPRVLFAACAAFVVCSSIPALAQKPATADPRVDTAADGRGQINYGAGTVKATGYGAPPANADSPIQARLMARGAARDDALRTLAMTVGAIQVTATTRVKNYVMQSDVVATKLNMILDSPRIVDEGFQRDGTAYMTVELPMYGQNSVASAVLPEVLPSVNASRGATGGAAGGAGSVNGTFPGPPEPAVRITPPLVPAPAVTLPGREPGLTPLSDPGPFSAVIVDCRGLGIEAIMSPKLYDTTGREVYGTVRVSPEYAIETGIVGYPRSMAEAIRSARAGRHPLIVRAVRAADKHRFHPVISLEDGDRIIAANNHDHFLERTAVIFLVDPVK